MNAGTKPGTADTFSVWTGVYSPPTSAPAAVVATAAAAVADRASPRGMAPLPPTPTGKTIALPNAAGVTMPSINLGTCCGSDPSVGLAPWLKAGGTGIDTAFDYKDQLDINAIINGQVKNNVHLLKPLSRPLSRPLSLALSRALSRPLSRSLSLSPAPLFN